ncbi:MAG: hypothetical protein ACE3L7_20850 [Candidatus Pristimantibacillus sp.]
MKPSLCISAICLLLFLSGCFNAQGPDLRLHQMDDIHSEMELQQIKGKPTDMIEQYQLDQSVQEAYELDNGELLYIYIFGSPIEMHSGLKTIKEQTALIDTIYSPLYYEANNAVLIYMMRNNEVPGVKSSMDKLAQKLGWREPSPNQATAPTTRP